MGAGEQDIYTHSDTFSIVVDHYGDARGTKSQFQKSDPSAIDPLINENAASYHFATEHLATSLTSIRSALEECWTGESANQALSIVSELSANAKTIGTNTKACHDSFVQFQQSWTTCKAAADNLYEGVGGSGVHEDNSGAKRVYSQFNTAMQTSMHAMPAHLRYSQPLDAQHAGQPGPGPGGGGPGGPGGYGPGGYGPGPGTYAGPGPGWLRPGHPGPGPGGFAGPGGSGGPGGPTVTNGTYQGGNGGYGPGSGLDTGAQLAGYTGGGMGGPGPGPGPGAGFGPGPGGVVTGAAGLSGSSAGLGSAGAIGAGAGISGVGAAESETAASGRPLLGGRGGAGGDDEDERDRTTWLSEEEGIWDGETSAPPGLIA